jgi:hypothetical protein
MRVDTNSLPSSLRSVGEKSGLQIVESMSGEAGPWPVACSYLPIHEQLPLLIAELPISMNFHRVVLDMDKEEDRAEYEKTMTYIAAGYGAQIVYQERKFIKKTRLKDGKKKSKRYVQRIFLEYYAPYRVVTPKYRKFFAESAPVPLNESGAALPTG